MSSLAIATSDLDVGFFFCSLLFHFMPLWSSLPVVFTELRCMHHCTSLTQSSLTKVKIKIKVKVKVILQPTVSQHTSGTRDQFFFLLEIFFRQLRVCYFVAPYLTRGRVCNLLLLLVLASAVLLGSESHGTQDHILLSQFLRLPRPGGSGPHPPGTGWPRYTPGHWISYPSPLMTRRATVEVFYPSLVNLRFSSPCLTTAVSCMYNFRNSWFTMQMGWFSVFLEGARIWGFQEFQESKACIDEGEPLHPHFLFSPLPIHFALLFF
jgi:hypothetical protein